MKKMFWLLLMATLVFGSCSKAEQKPAKAAEKATTVSVDTVKAAAEGYFSNYPGNRVVKAKDVMTAMDDGKDFLIVDIRQPDVYAQGHLKGAVNAPWGPALADALNWLPDDKPVYVNCYTGQTAGQTVAVLNIAGIKAYSIHYGWNLGISKTEGYENYIETTENMTPDPSGVKYDSAVKAAAEAYFKAIPQTGYNVIPAKELKAKMDEEEPMTIVSVRMADAYAEKHIEGAINIPFGKGMQEKFSQLPKDEPIYVYCYSGQTAGQTVGVLRMLGYDAVSVKSGMGTSVTGASGWGNEGLPTVQ